MNFPTINKSKITNYYVCMALTIEAIGGDEYRRKYYIVTYDDNSEYMFMTTDEPDSEYNVDVLDEDFTLVQSIETMLNDLENAEVKNLLLETRFNGPPFYIYYDIVIIDDFMKPSILKHLSYSLSGYTEEDFNKKEKYQIKIWEDYLSK